MALEWLLKSKHCPQAVRAVDHFGWEKIDDGSLLYAGPDKILRALEVLEGMIRSRDKLLRRRNKELKDLLKIVEPFLDTLRVQHCFNCRHCQAEPGIAAFLCMAHKNLGEVTTVEESGGCIYDPSEWEPWPGSKHEALMRLETSMGRKK